MTRISKKKTESSYTLVYWDEVVVVCGFEKEEKKLKKETGGFWDEYNNRGPGFVLADKSQCPPGRIGG